MQALSTQFKTCDIKGRIQRPVPDMVRHIHLSWHCLGAHDRADFWPIRGGHESATLDYGLTIHSQFVIGAQPGLP